MKKFVIEYVGADKTVSPSSSAERISDAITAFENAYEDASLLALENRPAVVRLINTLNGHALVTRKIN